MMAAGIPVRIKICGMRRMEDIEAVNAVRPEYAGFVFDSTRKRYIPFERARELAEHLDPFIEPVGVFVNAAVSHVLEGCHLAGIRTVQLHGQETNEYIEDLRRQADFPLRIIQAIRIEKREDVQRAEKSRADLILLDSGKGGTGTAFEWSLVKSAKRPFILAGGLGPDNVQAAIGAVHPAGVDASSSLETEGFKDPEKIRRFCEAVRSAE